MFILSYLHLWALSLVNLLNMNTKGLLGAHVDGLGESYFV